MKTKVLSYALYFLLLPSTLVCSQAVTNAQQTEFLVHKFNYLDACSSSYGSDEDICSCSFDYLRQHYDAEFYQHPFFKYEGVEPPHQMAEKLSESMQYCVYRSVTLALPRDFHKIQSISTPPRETED